MLYFFHYSRVKMQVFLQKESAPGNDNKTKTIYLYPPKNTAIQQAQFAVSHLTDLIHIIGERVRPVTNISISNIQFTQNSHGFMLTKEPLVRSDWTIYREAAILLDGTENISISNCMFSELGGNAVFLSNYNKNNYIKDNNIHYWCQRGSICWQRRRSFSGFSL